MAWGRFPVIGNVKLEILDQRMVDEGGGSYRQQGREKLIIRWRTAGGPTNLAAGTARIAQLLGRDPASKEKPPPSPFHGLFIFTFDEVGRILTHTIEHSAESRDAESVTSKVFNLTDWLIKKARGQEERTPELVWSRRGITVMQSTFSKPRPYKSAEKRRKPSASKPPNTTSPEIQARIPPSPSRLKEPSASDPRKIDKRALSSSKRPARLGKLTTVGVRLALLGINWLVRISEGYIKLSEEVGSPKMTRVLRDNVESLKSERRYFREILALELRLREVAAAKSSEDVQSPTANSHSSRDSEIAPSASSKGPRIATSTRSLSTSKLNQPPNKEGDRIIKVSYDLFETGKYWGVALLIYIGLSNMELRSPLDEEDEEFDKATACLLHDTWIREVGELWSETKL